MFVRSLLENWPLLRCPDSHCGLFIRPEWRGYGVRETGCYAISEVRCRCGRDVQHAAFEHQGNGSPYVMRAPPRGRLRGVAKS